MNNFGPHWKRDRRRIGADQPVDDRSDPLSWLSDILWPHGRARLVLERRRHRGEARAVSEAAGGDGDHQVGFRWWASPHPRTAEILIPATSAAGARAAVRRYHDGFSLRRRARSWLAELVMRAPGWTRAALDRRLVTSVGAVDDGILTDLWSMVESRAGACALHPAITLSRSKSNRKPIIQLIDQDGRTTGWAKIGWNPWTADLVDNEARWLRSTPNPPLVMPALLEDRTLRGHRVIVTDGFTPSRLPRRKGDLLPSPGLFLAVADLGLRQRLPLSDTPWWHSVEQVLPAAMSNEAAAVDQVLQLVGSTSIEIGAWHGDLTPWNIMAQTVRTGPPWFGPRGTKTRYQVIDWEFAADGVPLGFDLCHFHTQVAMEMKGMSASAALDHSARLSPQGLARLGVDPHNQITIYRLYLVELIRRTLALRTAGLPVDEVLQGQAAVARIGASALTRVNTIVEEFDVHPSSNPNNPA